MCKDSSEPSYYFFLEYACLFLLFSPLCIFFLFPIMISYCREAAFNGIGRFILLGDVIKLIKQANQVWERITAGWSTELKIIMCSLGFPNVNCYFKKKQILTVIVFQYNLYLSGFLFLLASMIKNIFNKSETTGNVNEI